MWDRLVFKKVQESMGGRLRLLVVGSAPLAGNVLTFMRCALSCVVSIFHIEDQSVLVNHRKLFVTISVKFAYMLKPLLYSYQF